MTNVDGWEQQPGGLWLKVVPYDKNDLEQRSAVLPVIRSSVQTIAQTHGASFSAKGFRNNEHAIGSGDLWVDLYLAKWELCDRNPVCVGNAYGWDTYYFNPKGQLVLSEYTEDVCINKSQLRQLIRSRPDGKDFPKQSLAECFERISLNQMRNDGVIYRFGEVDPDNATMMRQLNGNNANMGAGLNSAVLEYKQMPINLAAKWLTPTPAIHIKRHGIRSKRHFYVRWNEGPHDVRFLVTKGHATAIGKPRVDIRPWHNGNLPDQKILECVIASSLTSIKQVIDKRKWSNQQHSFPTPIIPSSDASRPEIFRALYDAVGNEVAINAANRPPSFDRPMSDAHVFVQNDQRMLKGFLANNAMQRFFGEKPMIPGVNVLRSEARLVV